MQGYMFSVYGHDVEAESGARRNDLSVIGAQLP
jgi:hypothetical protein